MFRNKTILITSGTGSFGQALVRRIIHEDIEKIIIFSRDEKKQDDMRLKYGNPKLEFHIGDVRDYKSVIGAMSEQTLFIMLRHSNRFLLVSFIQQKLLKLM